mgnify:CR=1 FL=1
MLSPLYSCFAFNRCSIPGTVPQTALTGSVDGTTLKMALRANGLLKFLTWNVRFQVSPQFHFSMLSASAIRRLLVIADIITSRLKVVPLDMPPLRERKDDIVPLAQYILRKSCQEYRKPPMSLSAQAEGAILMHPWPDNVLELENLISRAVVLSPRSIQQPIDLGFGFDTSATEVNLKFAKQAIDYDFVKKALTRNQGIISRAARELGISRVNLYELIDKYAIQGKQLKNSKTDKNSELIY